MKTAIRTLAIQPMLTAMAPYDANAEEMRHKSGQNYDLNSAWPAPSYAYDSSAVIRPQTTMSTRPPGRNPCHANLGRSTVRKECVTDNRTSIRLILHTVGLEVAEAASGEEALAEAARRRPDLILCDLKLPGLDGVEAIRALRDNRHLRDVPVIFMSGLPGDEFRGAM
jgi:hypothetical protein